MRYLKNQHFGRFCGIFLPRHITETKCWLFLFWISAPCVQLRFMNILIWTLIWAYRVDQISYWRSITLSVNCLHNKNSCKKRNEGILSVHKTNDKGIKLCPELKNDEEWTEMGCPKWMGKDNWQNMNVHQNVTKLSEYRVLEWLTWTVLKHCMGSLVLAQAPFVIQCTGTSSFCHPMYWHSALSFSQCLAWTVEALLLML